MDRGINTINQKTYSLYEVMQSVQSILHKTYSSRFFWVRCELSRISLHSASGHCYLELVDKNETSIVAQLKGIIWSEKYKSIYDKFQSVTNIPLASGMKVLFQCGVSFHPLHGLSLIISDVEPSFTLGEMARMKNESISKLKSEGIFNSNRLLRLSLFPQRLAIVSVGTSRGFHDFVSTITNHSTQFNIHWELFESILQGDNAVPSLIKAINAINGQRENFDAILIIRGGAGDAGLACYDEYLLASIIARSPLPVITGIGHATNETVVEMIAFKNCITPTAAAMFIIEIFESLYSQINILTEKVTIRSVAFLSAENQILISQSEKFSKTLLNQMNAHRFRLKDLVAGMPAFLNRYFALINQNMKQFVQTLTKTTRLSSHSLRFSDLERMHDAMRQHSIKFIEKKISFLNENKIVLDKVPVVFKSGNENLNHISEKINLLDPVNTLRRGYSITRHNGKAITEHIEVEKGMILETQLAKGVIKSVVDTI